MGFLYLLFVVLAITATAFVAKLAARHNVTPLDLATTLFGVGAVLGAVMLCRQLPVSITPQAVLFAAVGGVGGAFAVLAFNSAVREGHFGYSNAIYRSSFLVPVVYSVLFLNAPLKAATGCGIVLILAGIFLMSRSTESAPAGRTAPSRWVALILLAFLLSGAPRVGQTLINAHGENYYVYLFLSYLIGALILFGVILRRRKFNAASLPWGTGAAAASYLGVFCTLKALETLKPQLVFPISLSGPIFLGIVLSLGVFREKITGQGWAGALLGVSGILVLAIGK